MFLRLHSLKTYPLGSDCEHKADLLSKLNGKTGTQFRLTAVAPSEHYRGLAVTLKLAAEQRATAQGACFMYTRCTKRNLAMIRLNQSFGHECVAENGTFH